jgi:hypothetical protein
LVQERVTGLAGVPAPVTVRAVVPRVSVNVVVPALLVAVIRLPFRSVTVPEPLPDCSGALILAPERSVTAALGTLFTDAV